MVCGQSVVSNHRIITLDKDQKASGRNVVLKLINIIYQNMSNLSNLFLSFNHW